MMEVGSEEWKDARLRLLPPTVLRRWLREGDEMGWQTGGGPFQPDVERRPLEIEGIGAVTRAQVEAALIEVER